MVESFLPESVKMVLMGMVSVVIVIVKAACAGRPRPRLF
jgi:hypothetical protein